MQTEISFYKSEISKFKLSIEKYRKQKQELQNQIIQKQSDNNQADRRRRQIAHELKTTQQIITQLQREKQQINDVLQKTRNQLSALKRQKLSLDDVVDSLRDKESRIQSKVAFQQASLQQEFESLDSRVAERQQRLLAMQVGIQRIQQEKISGQADIKQISTRLEIMNKTLANREKEKQEHDILKSRLGQLRDEASSLNNSIIEKEKNVRQLQRMKYELENQQNQVSLNISEISENKEKQENQLKSYQSKIKQKKTEYEKMQKKVEEARERAHQIKQKARSAELKLVQIQQESKSKQQSFDSYKAELASFLSQINQIRSQFEGQKKKLQEQIEQRKSELNNLDAAVQNRAHQRMNLTNQLQHINDAKQETFQSFQEANKQHQELQLQMAQKLLGLKQKVKKAQGRLEEVKGILSNQQNVVEERREEIQYLSQKKDQILHQIEKQNESLNEIKRIEGEVARSVNKLQERKNVVNIQLAMYGERPDIQMQERITKITQSAMEAETLRKQLQEVEQEKLQMSSKLQHYQEVLSDLKSNSNYLESGFKQQYQHQPSNSSYHSLGVAPPVNTNISSPPPHKIGGNIQYQNPSGISFLSGIDSARSHKSTYRISKTSRQLAHLLKQSQQEDNRIIPSTRRDGSQTARASLSSSRKRDQQSRSKAKKLSSSKSMGKIKIPRLNFGLRKQSAQSELERIEEYQKYIKQNRSMQNRKMQLKKQRNNNSNVVNQTLSYKIQDTLANSFLSPTQNNFICQSARERKQYSSNNKSNVIKPSTSAMLMKPIDDMIHRLDAAKQRVQKLSARRKINLTKKKKSALEELMQTNYSSKNINKASFTSGKKKLQNRSTNKSRNFSNDDDDDDALGQTQTKQSKQQLKNLSSNNNNSSLSLLINSLHNQQKNKSNAYRRFAAANQQNLPSTTIDGTSFSGMLHNNNLQKSQPKLTEKNDEIIKEYLMYAGSDSNITMQMGGESIISNGLAISPKSLTISTPGRTTTTNQNNFLLTGKLKSPGGQFINLNVDKGSSSELVSPKGSGTPKTLR